jgi:hypothetical protein
LASTEIPTYVPLPRAMSRGVEVRKRNLKVPESMIDPSDATLEK